MRILHLVHQYPPEHVGGTEIYTQSLSRIQARRGHTVAVFHPSSLGSGSVVVEQDIAGVRSHAAGTGPRTRTRVFLDSFAGKQLRQAFATVLSQEQPEVVHVQHLMGLPLALLGHLTAANIPYVITLHDYWYPCANAQLITNYDSTICAGPDRWFHNCGRCAFARIGRPNANRSALLASPLMAYRSRRMRRALARAFRLIAPTDFVSTVYKELGMPAANIAVVPHGIEIPAELPGTESPWQETGPGRPLHVGYVGSLSWQKGIHLLIEAVNDLPDDHVRLSIYGDLNTFPDYTNELRRQARHPGIRFAGSVSRDKLWPALADLDVVVMPTQWFEASPLTIQEVFAVGVPIVASRIGAVQELIADGKDGFLVPPGDVEALRDRLALLIYDRSLLARLRAGIGPVRTMDQHNHDIEELYVQALAAPSTKSGIRL